MTKPLVGVVMGSNSDWEVMRHATLRRNWLRWIFLTRLVWCPRTARLICCLNMPKVQQRVGLLALSQALAVLLICRACWRPRPPYPY